MNATNKIRCVCEKCERKQMRSVDDVINGERCNWQSLKVTPCGGTLNYFSENWEDAILNMQAVMGYLNDSQLLNGRTKLEELIDTVVNDVGRHCEVHDTPQQMGWVNSKGLP